MIFKDNDKEYRVDIVRKDNKNTYIRVNDEIITVTTSYYVSNNNIKNLLEKNRKSIVKMIEKDKKLKKKRELFLIFGKYYDVIYGDFDHQITVDDENGKIFVISEDVLIKWLNQLINTTFYQRLKQWQRSFEEEIPDPNLKIKKMKSRWGVCNRKTNTITLNFELFRYERECLDYVAIHELAHFLVPNHSKEFWNIVAKYCPNYKEIRKKLRS